MGGFHAATLESERVRLRVWDSDSTRATVGTVEEALDGADAVVIATPAPTHATLVKRCVEQSLPVFCEKPLDTDLAKSIALVELIEQAGGVVRMGFQRRFDASFANARATLLHEGMGRAHAFAMASFDRTLPPPEFVSSSGGLFRDMHVHDFDSIRWLFGQEVVEVQAIGTAVDAMFAKHDDVDTSAVLLRLADGTMGTIAGGRVNPAGYTARLDVYGCSESVSVREDRRYVDFLDRYAEAYRAEIRSFLRVARGEVDVACTARDALEALRVAEAAELSRRERRTVAVAEIPNAKAKSAV
jgi:myo-inositol 2-dehydrogenase/D-chiro-inositol 1-dehydrogenase